MTRKNSKKNNDSCSKVMFNSETVTQKDLISVLNVSKSTIVKWTKCKNPVPRVPVGRYMQYNLNQIYQWMLSTGKDDIAAKLEKHYCKKSQPDKKNDSKDSAADIEIPDIDNIDALSLEQVIDRMLRIINQKIIMLEQTPATSAINSTQTKNLTGLTTACRQLIKDQLEMDIKLKKVIPLSIVIRVIGQIQTNLRINFMQLPFSIRDDLAGMDSPDEIQKFLETRFQAMLNQTANRFKDTPELNNENV